MLQKGGKNRQWTQPENDVNPTKDITKRTNQHDDGDDSDQQLPCDLRDTEAKSVATLFANTRIEHHVSTAFMQLIMCMT
jgi:hypothetical protein